MGMGAFAYAALGAAHQAQGFAAGLLGAAVCALVLAVLGFRGAAVHVPRSVTGVFVTALVAALPGMGVPADQALAAAFLMCMLAGLFQVGMGALKWGTLVRFCPHPVVAGFMNAMALLLAFSQVAPVLGWPAGRPWPGYADLATGAAWEAFKPLNLVVVAVTVAWILHPPRWSRAVPGALGGVVVGSLFHQVLVLVGASPWLGAMLGQGAWAWPPWDAGLQGLHLLVQQGPGAWLWELLAWSFALAVLASLDHLLSAKAFESTSHDRRDPNADLVRLGWAHAATAGLGGVPCSISLAASQVNHQAGGRGLASQWRLAVLLLALAAGLAPLAATVPRAVVAAMLLTVAWRLFDRPMMKLTWHWVRSRGPARHVLRADLLVSWVVVLVALYAGMLAGVAVGVLLSAALFIAAMRRSVVRSIRAGDQVASRQLRPAADRQSLRECRDPVVVIELEGLFYFGTADHLQASVERLLAREGGPPSHVVLDWRRVRYLDLTGAHLLGALARQLQVRGVKLWFSHLSPSSPPRQTLEQAAEMALLNPASVFEDTDRAVEQAEDEVLARRRDQGCLASPQAWLPEAMAPLDRLSQQQRQRLLAVLQHQSFQAGQPVFGQGDAGDSMFFITQGSASVYRAVPMAPREPRLPRLPPARPEEAGPPDGPASRLATFRAGAFFGEMALLSGQPRDASVIAETTLSVSVLHREHLDQLAREDASLAAAFFEGLASELAARLRQANRTVDSLRD